MTLQFVQRLTLPVQIGKPSAALENLDLPVEYVDRSGRGPLPLATRAA